MCHAAPHTHSCGNFLCASKFAKGCGTAMEAYIRYRDQNPSAAICYFLRSSQGMDRGAYRSIVEMAMKPRVEGDDGDQIKKAITELVITHYNLVMGRHYTIGSTTGVLSGVGRRKKRFASFGSSWTSNSFDNGWDTSRGYGSYGGGGGYGSSGNQGYSGGNQGYGGGNQGYGSSGNKGYSGGNQGYNSGGNKGYTSNQNSYRSNPWESDPWRNDNSYNRDSGYRDNDGYSNRNFDKHNPGYGTGKKTSDGGYGSNSGYSGNFGSDPYHTDRVYRPKPKKVTTKRPERQIINCPVQSNQSSVYKLNATGDAYPAIEIGAELFARSQPGSDLFFFCLFPRAITPGQAPVLEVDQNFVTANMTCPSQDLTLFSYRYQNTAFGGHCWIVQGFQEVVKFSICMTKSCVNCKLRDLQEASKNQKKGYDDHHHHHHDGYGYHHHHDDHYGQKSNNVTVSRCFTEYRVIQVVSYCENLPLNQRIIYDRIVIPAFCNCKSYFCQIQDHKTYY
ncbi:hypothetical protein RRG08_038663 [Elysia crispata]|uniref:Uncharacterized protein n=1 Tax=Elysia crispata TaxID=231223 RepID=A0AAE0ZIY2_9GAST|nr:hypothetical protein RRG08_038663 [Elysia crispata]